jgi:hypothetical protein
VVVVSSTGLPTPPPALAPAHAPVVRVKGAGGRQWLRASCCSAGHCSCCRPSPGSAAANPRAAFEEGRSTLRDLACLTLIFSLSLEIS